MIEKFFPYNSLFSDSSDSLTGWFIIGLLVLFFCFLIVMIFVVSKLTSQIKKTEIGDEGKEIDEAKLASSNYLESLWNDYSNTFDESNKTHENAYEYFNESNLLATSSIINLRLITSISNILVGLGVLGTFLGLTLGIANFNDVETTEAIKKGINELLSGMSTSFLTSVWGMLLSIVFTIIEKVAMNKLYKQVYKLCYELDKKHKFTKKDEIDIQITAQRDILADFFISTTEEGQERKPGNILRDIFSQSERQTQALKAFSTDLAIKIEAGFEKMLEDQNESIVPLLKQLKEEIQNLGENLKSPTEEMTQNIVKDLEVALNKMIEEFKASVSDSTKNEMESLAKILERSGKSLEAFPQHLEKMTGNLSTNFEDLQGVVKEISANTLSQGEDSMKQMKEVMDLTTKGLSQKVGALQQGQENLLNKQSENLQISSDLFEALNGSIDNMKGLSTEITGTISQFGSVQKELGFIASELKSSSSKVNLSTEAFKSSQDNFINHSDKFLSENQKTLQEVKNALETAKSVSSDYSQKFEVIESGLKGIFSQINNGLNQYSDNVKANTEKFLNEYTNALTKTAQALAEASSKQENILEELSDQLSKFKR